MPHSLLLNSLHATALGSLSAVGLTLAVAVVTSALLADWRLRREHRRELQAAAHQRAAWETLSALERAQYRALIRRRVDQRLQSAYEHTARPNLEHLLPPTRTSEL